METLFERLSKSNQKKIMDYEHTMLRDSIMNDLNTKYYWHDLTLENAIYINNLLLKTALDIFDFTQLFSKKNDEK